MKFVGLALALIGWLIPVVGLTLTSSLAARYVLCFVGFAVILVGVLGVLNKAHLKEAVWKR